MTIAIYEFDAKDDYKLVGDSLIFRADNNQSKVQCITNTPNANNLPVDQKAAKEFLGVRLVQCPNTGTFSTATSDTFYWYPEDWKRYLIYSGSVTVKCRIEKCTICGYMLRTEGDPNLTASFYPERGGHSGIPHPDRTYMPDPIDDVIIKDAWYDARPGAGIVASSNQGTVGILCSPLTLNHPTTADSVKRSVNRYFPGAEILYMEDRTLIFQDGPTGHE